MPLPTDANGVHSLPDGYLAVTGETVLASQHNPPLEDLSDSVTTRLPRSGVAPMTGPLKSADGTVSAPGITMASATSSGWYKTADGWGFSIGGAMVAEITAGGIRTGARYLGELIPYAGLTAQPLTVLPYGQTLSRTTYAALWAYAQDEIAAGNTLYNNGNGTTTFGILDMRGRVATIKDDLGGSAASRVTSTTMTPDGNTLGAVGGGQTATLLTANLPPYTPAGSIASSSTLSAAVSGNGGPASAGGTGQLGTTITANTITSTFTGTAQGGTSVPVNTLQPSIVVGCLLFAGA
jgi:microcystin-dependent protein